VVCVFRSLQPDLVCLGTAVFLSEFSGRIHCSASLWLLFSCIWYQWLFSSLFSFLYVVLSVNTPTLSLSLSLSLSVAFYTASLPCIITSFPLSLIADCHTSRSLYLFHFPYVCSARLSPNIYLFVLDSHYYYCLPLSSLCTAINGAIDGRPTTCPIAHTIRPPPLPTASFINNSRRRVPWFTLFAFCPGHGASLMFAILAHHRDSTYIHLVGHFFTCIHPSSFLPIIFFAFC
jgi:hypothetical protein